MELRWKQKGEYVWGYFPEDMFYMEGYSYIIKQITPATFFAARAKLFSPGRPVHRYNTPFRSLEEVKQFCEKDAEIWLKEEEAAYEREHSLRRCNP